MALRCRGGRECLSPRSPLAGRGWTTYNRANETQLRVLPTMPRTTKSLTTRPRPSPSSSRGRADGRPSFRAPSRSSQREPTTLAVDVGGSHVKASVLDSRGRMLHERVRVDTPEEPTPQQLVRLIAGLVPQLPRFDRVSVGFPGVVRNGVVRTAPNLGTDRFRGFRLAAALERRLGRPVRVENDADVQGLAAVKGKGVELVVTLGTGFGSSIFVDGHLGPHLELAHHPFRYGKTYEEELGDAGRKKHGNRYWKHRVEDAIQSLRSLTNFDHLYIGGGNARLVDIELPHDVSIVSNTAGILGGARLWG